MSMAPVRSQRICPVCGDSLEGGCHPCNGPREDVLVGVETAGADHRLELIAARASRIATAAVVTLPGDDPLEARTVIRRVKRHAPDEDNP
jgi:hypothetical protein